MIVTTNEVGRSKTDGLFDLVLKKHGIAANDIVYFGNNELRDVQAAQRTDILAVLDDESRESRLEDLAMWRIKSWGEHCCVYLKKSDDNPPHPWGK